MQEIPTFCRVCEPSCGLIAEVENGEIQSLRPDKNHPVTKGFACHKGLATLDIHKDPDRLMYPQIRNNEGQLERVSWDEAASYVATKMAAIRDQYGETSLASYTGNPLAFNSTAGAALGSFMVKNRIRRNFSSGTQDCTNKFAGSEAMFGSSTIHPIPDIDNTDFLLMFGANPRVSHMSFISIADPMAALRDAKKRGAKIHFVDPRENESVKGIGEAFLVNPDTDVYLMLGMLNHLHTSGQFDDEYINNHGDNIEGLINLINKYSPDKIAGIVGQSADAIRQLADDFSGAPKAAIYMSTGVNMGRQGTLAYWLMFMLSLVTGNLGKSGGNRYGRGFYPAARAGRTNGEVPTFDQTEFGEVRRIRGSLPGNLLADYIEDATTPVKGLIVTSGNPLLSMGNGDRLKTAFEKLELIVVIDIYPNATASVADVVLPAADMYERADINMCGLGLQHTPFVQFTDMIVPPKAERRPEWWILGKLEQACGFEAPVDLDDPALFGRFDHMLGHSDLSIDDLRSKPSQTAVFPRAPADEFFTDVIQTESGHVDCFPAQFAESIERCSEIFSEYSATDKQPLKLISRRTNYMVNSWFHNVASLKTAKQRNNPLFMHPEDARERNLGEGSTVQIANEFGQVETVVALDEGLKPGSVAMTHGWGHQGTGMSTASANPGVNANVLLPSGPGSYEKISNQAFMTGVPVEVEALG